jgi:hypothetical protein
MFPQEGIAKKGMPPPNSAVSYFWKTPVTPEASRDGYRKMARNDGARDAAEARRIIGHRTE